MNLMRHHLLALCLSAAALPAFAASTASVADAAEHGDSASVTALLEEHSATATQPDGTTALHWAALHNDASMAQALLNAGADADPNNQYGITPLALACENGSGALTRVLLKAGADPNKKFPGGETPLMTAARTGRLDAVTALIESGAELDTPERRGQTALMWAAHEGHADVIDALIKSGADFNATNKAGFTALLYAARQGHEAATRRLIDAGVDVNQVITQDKSGRNMPLKNTSPLLMAMENGHMPVALILLEAGADPNDMRTGAAPLHALSWIRKPQKGDGESGTPPPIISGGLTALAFAHHLVQHGAEIDKPRPSGYEKAPPQMTPFLAAARTADIELMATLLELGADPTATNKAGQNALMLVSGITEGPEGDGPATFEEHNAAIEYVLGLDVLDINARDHRGETAMHGAAYKMGPTIVELLDARGADPNVWVTPGNSGRTPHSIAHGDRPGNFKPAFDVVATLEKILKANNLPIPDLPKRAKKKWDQ